jgi:LmbE family N-acetylglucosaminyl deacetylase
LERFGVQPGKPYGNLGDGGLVRYFRRRRTTLCPSRPLHILVVFAHPDDESFGPAAILAKYARRGAKIYGVIATRGEFGNTDIVPRPSPEELGRLRERDLHDAAAAIGFTRLDVLGYRDGTLADVPLDELAHCILDAIRRYRPDVVVTFGPTGVTCHPDHLAIHRAATTAFRRAMRDSGGPCELYYPAVTSGQAARFHLDSTADSRPNTFVDVSKTFPIKLKALRLHGRHIVDAREMANTLEREPQTIGVLHRAWPLVPDGVRLTGFMQGVAAKGRSFRAAARNPERSRPGTTGIPR